MFGMVPLGRDPPSDGRCRLGVDQEPRQAVRRTG
jgi:hypothetical protein